jgi:ring-1,2-phenylacetyl-CoA epoxidase subunit PaaE
MFYNLTVKAIKRETPETVSVSFDIPENLKTIFEYTQGQYLTFKKTINGEELRRSYSLSSSPTVDSDLRVAIKQVEGGRFSTWANTELQAGDVLETMAPMGGFFTELQKFQKKHYVFFAAGSGITPILSIIKTTLDVEEYATCTLVYGNKNPEHTIYKAELDALANENPERFNLTYVFSQDSGVDALNQGRITANKCDAIETATENLFSGSEYFLCGPEEMINDVTAHLVSKGINKDNIHFELFTAPAKSAEKTVDESAEITSQVTVIMDDEEMEFELSSKGDTLLDAAVDAGVDAPFSCKGAVCCTCKAKVIEGHARMEMNYALSDDEVEEGYILSCQAHPTTEKCVVDFDVV